MALRNILRNARNPRLFPEMMRKLVTRTRYGFGEYDAAREWASDVAMPIDQWAIDRAPALWDETQRFVTELREYAQTVLRPLDERGIDLGGGGSIELLYFMVRLHQPELVLETGVAAGWSSHAVLAALEHNGHGQLRSSDFPYFRMVNPEQYVGVLVPDNLKHRWSLALHGDRRNLSKLLEKGDRVDLVHYDSDKSRPGRDWFAKAIQPYLATNATIIWDDIVDNLAFRDRLQLAKDSFVLDTANGLVGVEVSR
jgi:predicted O-methyltransferase YrrM